MSEETAVKINNYGEVVHDKICYYKHEDTWYLYLPKCGLGNLKAHTIVEHEDGTISVTPSILVTGHSDGNQIKRHGYLTRGVWVSC